MKYPVPILFLILFSCISPEGPNQEAMKNEVRKAENDFCKMAADSGLASAFVFYAADNAVLLRGNELVAGKNAIAEMMASQNSDNTTLSWEPDYIDVAASGDLAYTYGKFIYFTLTPDGDTISSNGIFHTVWKKQEDGSWKYVWD
jgi:ketosteroid isomerase-like protein